MLDSRIARELRGFSGAQQRQEAFQAVQDQARTMPALVETLQTMMAQMERQIDQDGLKADLAAMDAADQVLVLSPLDSRDPDEALSEVAYTKGSWFLKFLESRVGREKFDPFLRGWFDDHAFQSTDSAAFVAYLRKHLLEANPGAVRDEELDEWLNKPGIPAYAQRAQSRTFSRSELPRLSDGMVTT